MSALQQLKSWWITDDPDDLARERHGRDTAVEQLVRIMTASRSEDNWESVRERLRPVVEEPARRPVEQPPRLHHQRVRHGRRDVRFAQRRPQRREVVDGGGGSVGAHRVADISVALTLRLGDTGFIFGVRP